MLRSPQVALVAMADAPFRRQAGAPAVSIAVPDARLPPPGGPAVARGGLGILGDTLRPDELRPLPATP